MDAAGRSDDPDEVQAKTPQAPSDNESTRQPAPVVDPYLPAEARRRLVRRIGRAESELEAGLGCTGLAFGVLGAITVIILHSVIGLSWWWIFASALPVLIAFVAASFNTKLDSLDHKQFVVSSDLDASCCDLLLRTQDAIGTVHKSDVYAENLLEHTVEETALRRHEWEVATTLREISGLRKEYEASRNEKTQGPMTNAVLDSHHQALELATDATVSRIKVLECYAEQVRIADDALHDWRNAQKASGLNDRYLDLIARTAADEHAIAEIQGLTEEATTAAQMFRESLDQVSVAAEALVLPPLSK